MLRRKACSRCAIGSILHCLNAIKRKRKNLYGLKKTKTTYMVQRIELAHKCLKGISIGDAFGESFFGERNLVEKALNEQKIPDTSWDFTDDTIMSIAIVNILEKYGEINQDELAKLFAQNYQKDQFRGYGGTAHKILREIGEGNDWREVAKNVFDGMGSMGNGGAMRSAPIGAYFYDDLEKVKIEAQKSAEVTHAHKEGIVGAIAVALASALATQMKKENKFIDPQDFITTIFKHLPDSDTKYKINKINSVPATYRVSTVVSILGNGSRLLAKDTVPYALWCVVHHFHDFEKGLWKAVNALGDRDTICAITAGILMMCADEKTVPESWLKSVEKIGDF